MQTKIFETRVTALSSISHNGGDSFGTMSLLRREKYVMADGSVAEIPVISGNGLRGLLRDRGMLHMCRALGYGVNAETGEVRGLSLGAFYFLFSGGSLGGGSAKGIDVDQMRTLRTLIPLVSVFGGAVQSSNMILPGKLICGKLIPICAETLHLLPERFRNPKAESIWEYCQREMYTRKDDEKNEHLRAVIAPTVRGYLDAARAEKEKRSTTEPQEDTGHHQQMKYEVETLAAGTQFYWQLCLRDVNQIEYEAFCAALAEFLKLPYIGGKSNVGLGRVRIDCEEWREIDSVVASASTTTARPLCAAYAAHLKEHAAEIREELARIP